jgi:heme-degrading monooxygenase HmoA
VIARIWRGWAPQARAGDYQRHYESEVSGHLRAVSGFRSADLLRRNEGTEVMFTSITWFTDLEAVRDFAGDDYEQAVVEDAARAALSRWDERVSHHEAAVQCSSRQIASRAGQPAQHDGGCRPDLASRAYLTAVQAAGRGGARGVEIVSSRTGRAKGR